jgi:hypothetical protein
MKRTPLKRRTPLRSKRHEPSVEREPKPYVRPTVQSLHRGVYGGTTSAAPKTSPKRNPALLEMAEKRPCLLRVPGVCNGDPDTTVACHSNASVHGKAGARKADDCYSVWGCASCHRWLDQPIGVHGPTYDQKQARFALAHLDQVIEWRRIANDPSEPVRFRRAAQWALEQLNATPGAAE